MPAKKRKASNQKKAKECDAVVKLNREPVKFELAKFRDDEDEDAVEELLFYFHGCEEAWGFPCFALVPKREFTHDELKWISSLKKRTLEVADATKVFMLFDDNSVFPVPGKFAHRRKDHYSFPSLPPGRHNIGRMRIFDLRNADCDYTTFTR